jgi:hypothetical protein
MLGEKLQQGFPVFGLLNLVYFLHGGSLSFQGITWALSYQIAPLREPPLFIFRLTFHYRGGPSLQAFLLQETLKPAQVAAIRGGRARAASSLKLQILKKQSGGLVDTHTPSLS